jgi:hypothetical protein
MGGGVIRTLIGESRTLVSLFERSKEDLRGNVFELNVPAAAERGKSGEKVSDLTLLIMTCASDLPSAIYLNNVHKNIGRGPSFNGITIATDVLEQGFTLVFEPATRKLSIAGMADDGQHQWFADDDIASREAAAADLQQAIDARSEPEAARKATILKEMWQGNLEKEYADAANAEQDAAAP